MVSFECRCTQLAAVKCFRCIPPVKVSGDHGCSSKHCVHSSESKIRHRDFEFQEPLLHSMHSATPSQIEEDKYNKKKLTAVAIPHTRAFLAEPKQLLLLDSSSLTSSKDEETSVSICCSPAALKLWSLSVKKRRNSRSTLFVCS